MPATIDVRNCNEKFVRFAETRDPKLRDELILAHQPLVRILASRFRSSGQELEDLIQAGNIGLITAVNGFDPSRGLKFSSYAVPCIVGAIRRHFRDCGWAMKVPRKLKELNLRARKASEQMEQNLWRRPTHQDIATAIGISEEEVLEALKVGAAYEFLSLDDLVRADEEAGDVRTFDELCGQPDPFIEELIRYDDLRQAIELLPPELKVIVKWRYFKGMTQAEVAQKLGYDHQMQISRLQKKAMRQLKLILEKD